MSKEENINESNNKNNNNGLFLDEGYVKYNCHWNESEAVNYSGLEELNLWRKNMYDLKLIGYYEQHRVGYGNISMRFRATAEDFPSSSSQFVISGTQTGHLPTLDATHYALVNKCDLEENELTCSGPCKASSESLTHSVFYKLDSKCQAVIHIHNLDLWKALMYKVPTTKVEVPYGTPEMAKEIIRLYGDSELPTRKLVVMAGHDEGIIAFGDTLEEAGQIILDLV